MVSGEQPATNHALIFQSIGAPKLKKNSPLVFLKGGRGGLKHVVLYCLTVCTECGTSMALCGGQNASYGAELDGILPVNPNPMYRTVIFLWLWAKAFDGRLVLGREISEQVRCQPPSSSWEICSQITRHPIRGARMCRSGGDSRPLPAQGAHLGPGRGEHGVVRRELLQQRDAPMLLRGHNSSWVKFGKLTKFGTLGRPANGKEFSR